MKPSNEDRWAERPPVLLRSDKHEVMPTIAGQPAITGTIRGGQR
jgi:hypothetical protein